MKNNCLYIKEEDGKIVVSSSDGVFSSIITLDDKEAFKNYCERKAKEWRESILGIVGTSSYATIDDMVYIAKHFFELGLKTQKGEEV